MRKLFFCFGLAALALPAAAQPYVKNAFTTNVAPLANGLSLFRTNTPGFGILEASNVFVTPFASGAQVGVPFRMFSVTNDVITTNVSTGPISLLSNLTGTVTLPANFLQPGMTIRVWLQGNVFSPASLQNWTNAVTLGGTLLATNTAPIPISLAAGDDFGIDFMITCRSIGASGSVYCQGGLTPPNAVGSMLANRRKLWLASGPVTVNTTGTLALDVTVHCQTTLSFWIRQGYAMVIP